MFCRALALALLFVTLRSVEGGMDLTAERQEYVREGIIYEQITFKDGERSVTLQMPPRWKLRSSSARIDLLPPNGQFTSAAIEATSLESPLPPWDEDALKALTERALASVPPSSQNVELVTEEHNTVVLDGRIPSFEVVVSYQALGQNFKRSTVFINLPETELIARFTAPESEFDSLNGSFQRALGSWTWN
jgi:hypothetical protein